MAAGGFGGDAIDFVREAVAALRSPRLLVPAGLLTLILTGSNIVILLNIPVEGQAFPWPFAAAAVVRIAGLVILFVPLLRIANHSSRPAWRPDGAFWLYALTTLLGMVAVGGAEVLAGGPDRPIVGLAIGIAWMIVTAPLVVWFAAIAIARPLAWRPGPWMRGLDTWLAPFILWSILILTPLGELHAFLDRWLVEGAGPWFWPVALIDGPLSAAMILASVGLVSAAYRRVARS